MDNFSLKVIYTGKESLKTVLSLAFLNCAGGKAVGWSIENNTMILYWTECKSVKEYQAFPCNFDLDASVDFVWTWLEQAKYGEEPDHDGDNEKGWHVFNEAWGHVKGRYQAFVAIEPIYAMYGK